MPHVIVLALLLAAQQPQQLPRPTFETGVDVILVDVHVVDKQGKPILDLRPQDFEVQVSGQRRPIASRRAPGTSRIRLGSAPRWTTRGR